MTLRVVDSNGRIGPLPTLVAVIGGREYERTPFRAAQAMRRHLAGARSAERMGRPDQADQYRATAEQWAETLTAAGWCCWCCWCGRVRVDLAPNHACSWLRDRWRETKAARALHPSTKATTS